LAQGRTYRVKLENPALGKELASYNGKVVTLGGKIRNQGRYFIVAEILTQAGNFTPAQSNTAPGRL